MASHFHNHYDYHRSLLGLGWCACDARALSPILVHGLADHLLGTGSCPGTILPPPHTPRVEPDQTVSASGQGTRDNRGVHRTLKDIAALYRFGLPGGSLNGKGRKASHPIAQSWQPARPPFGAESPEATTLPFNGHLIPAGIE